MKKKLVASLLLAAAVIPTTVFAVQPGHGQYEGEPLVENGYEVVNDKVVGFGHVTGVPTSFPVESDNIAPTVLETAKGDQAGGVKVASSAAVYDEGMPEASIEEVEAEGKKPAAPAADEKKPAADEKKVAEGKKAATNVAAAKTETASKALPKTSAVK